MDKSVLEEMQENRDQVAIWGARGGHWGGRGGFRGDKRGRGNFRGNWGDSKFRGREGFKS